MKGKVMKIVISADIEGIAGLVSDREIGYPRHTIGDPQESPDYLKARKWLTEDINAAIEGAKAGGATSFVVHDTHGSNYRNINLDDLNPAAEYVGGIPMTFYEYPDLEENKYDGAFMIGMHARAGQKGILSHVLDWPLLREVRINTLPVGESQITAALAGYYGIPTVLITGDDLICNEVKAWTNGQIETAIVKKSFSRYAARCLPLKEARNMIKEAACRAVQRIKEIQPGRFAYPIRLEVDFNDRESARYVSWMPQIEYDGDCTVAFTGADFLKVFQVLCAMYCIAASQHNS
jgi:D-amino peptidase